jgi:hypothetical protein
MCSLIAHVVGMRRGGLGTGRMGHVEVAPGRCPERAYNGRWHRRSSAQDRRGHVECVGQKTPRAMRLLWLRQTAQHAPDTPATEVVSHEVSSVVPRLDGRSGAPLTASDVWRALASFGGSLNRKRDGPPEWQTFWKGWWSMQTVFQGVRRAMRVPPEGCVYKCQLNDGEDQATKREESPPLSA